MDRIGDILTSWAPRVRSGSVFPRLHRFLRRSDCSDETVQSIWWPLQRVAGENRRNEEKQQSPFLSLPPSPIPSLTCR